MISTRLHGAIDFGVAALEAGLAASPSLPPSARRALGVAGACHAGVSLLTDYEAGLSPLLSIRQHLILEVLGGSALAIAGLKMRGLDRNTRAILLGLGVAELAAVALTDPRPVSGPGQGSWGERMAGVGSEAKAPRRACYPPLDVPKQVADGVFVIDSVLPGLLGRVLPIRMTAIRLPGGGLLLHSPTPYSLSLNVALQAIGPIRHLVAPSFAHWSFLDAWQRACPAATTWATPGLRKRAQVRRSDLRLDRDLGEIPPPEWGDVLELTTIAGGAGFRETALFHTPTRTLVLTDLAMRLEPEKVPAVMRPLLRLFGTLAPDSMPPPYLRAIVKMGQPEAGSAALRLVGFQPERVIFAHGAWFQRDATAELRRSLRWLIRDEMEAPL